MTLYARGLAGTLESQDAVAVLGWGTPGAPSINVSNQSAGLQVAISRPAANGAIVFAYLITWTGPTSGSATVAANYTNLITTYTINGLTSAQNYTVTVHGINLYGLGASSSQSGEPGTSKFDVRTWDCITGTGPTTPGSLTAITQAGALYQGTGGNTGILSLQDGSNFSAVHFESTYFENPTATSAPNPGGLGIIEPTTSTFSMINGISDVPIHVDKGINNSNVTLGISPVIQDFTIDPSPTAATFENNKDGAIMGFGGLMRRVFVNPAIDGLYPIGNSVYDNLWIAGQTHPFFEGGPFNNLPPGDVPMFGGSGTRTLPSVTNIDAAQAAEVQSVSFGEVAGTYMSGAQGENPSQAFFRAELGSQYAFQVVSAGTIDVSPGYSNSDEPWTSWPKPPYTKMNPGDATQPFISVNGAITSLYPNQSGGSWDNTFSLYGPSFTATTSEGASTITVSSDVATAFTAGQVQTIVGPNLPPNTIIESISGTTATLSNKFTQTATNATYTTVETATYNTSGHAVLISLGNVYHSDGVQIASDIQQNFLFRGCRIENNSNSCFIFQNQLTKPGVGTNRGNHPGGPYMVERTILSNQNQFQYLQCLNGSDAYSIGFNGDPGPYSRVSDPADTSGTWTPYGPSCTASPSAGQNTLTISAAIAAAFNAGSVTTIVGPGLTGDTVITSVSGTTATLSNSFTSSQTNATYTATMTYYGRPWGVIMRDIWAAPQGATYQQPGGPNPGNPVYPSTINDMLITGSGLYWNPGVFVPSEFAWLTAMCRQYDLALPVDLTSGPDQVPDQTGTMVTTSTAGAPSSGTFAVGCNLYSYTGLSGDGVTMTGVTLLDTQWDPASCTWSTGNPVSVAGYTVPAGSEVIICDHRMLQMLCWSDFDAALADQTKPYVTPSAPWYVPCQDTTLPPVNQSVLENRYQLGLIPQRCGAEAWYIWKNIYRTDLGGKNAGGLLLPKQLLLSGLGQNWAGDGVYKVTVSGTGSVKLSFQFGQTVTVNGKAKTIEVTYTTGPISATPAATDITAALLAAISSPYVDQTSGKTLWPGGTTFSTDVPGAAFKNQAGSGGAFTFQASYQIPALLTALATDTSGLSGGSATFVKQASSNLPAAPGHDIQWQQTSSDAFPGYVRGDI